MFITYLSSNAYLLISGNVGIMYMFHMYYNTYYTIQYVLQKIFDIQNSRFSILPSVRLPASISSRQIVEEVNKQLRNKNKQNQKIIWWPSTVSNYGLFCHVKCKAFLVYIVRSSSIYYSIIGLILYIIKLLLSLFLCCSEFSTYISL